MLKRSDFLKQGTILLAGAALLPQDLFGKSQSKNTICILHTNDFHSRFHPFPSNHNKWPNQGGITRLTGLIDKFRHENEHVLLFDSGDVFQGTPYFNVFKGHPELKWMQNMNYDATTIGNHDFDLGFEHLAELRTKYNTPTLNCNYKINNSLTSVIKPYKIIQKGNVRIGVTGIGIDLKGLLSETAYTGLTYQDPIEPLQSTVNHLKNKEDCDFIVVLSHLGYSYDSQKIDDLKLAAKTDNIDVILGGHTHTFLDKPTTVKNKSGKQVLVNQVGWSGLVLGKIVFEV
jgi:5'-nucleotidase